MTLFGIGPGELILIFILALIIFGPQRLPEVARTIGKTINDFRKTSEEVTSAVAKELDLSEAATVSEKPPADSQPAIRPIHSIPLSKVGEVVADTPLPEGETPPAAVTDETPSENRETSDEGGPAQHD